MAYCDFSDIERHFESFGTGYYGSMNGTTLFIATTQWQSDIDASYGRMNILLDAVDRIPKVPIGTNLVTGSYHHALKEWNACDTIYTKLRARHSVEYNGNLPEWMLYFGSRSRELFTGIVDGNISLDLDTTNKGIGYPENIIKMGVAKFYSNWDTGYYSQSEYPKVYHFKVTEGSVVGIAKFQVSYDDGFSYDSDAIDTGTSWIDIEGGLKIRWENAGTLLGTQQQLVVNDEYKVSCIPINTRSVNVGVRASTWKRG
jgi:hypothetical protein